MFASYSYPWVCENVSVRWLTNVKLRLINFNSNNLYRLLNFYVFLLRLQHLADALIQSKLQKCFGVSVRKTETHSHASSQGQGLRVPLRRFCETQSFYVISINKRNEHTPVCLCISISLKQMPQLKALSKRMFIGRYYFLKDKSWLINNFHDHQGRLDIFFSSFSCHFT